MNKLLPKSAYKAIELYSALLDHVESIVIRPITLSPVDSWDKVNKRYKITQNMLDVNIGRVGTSKESIEEACEEIIGTLIKISSEKILKYKKAISKAKEKDSTKTNRALPESAYRALALYKACKATRKPPIYKDVQSLYVNPARESNEITIVPIVKCEQNKEKHLIEVSIGDIRIESDTIDSACEKIIALLIKDTSEVILKQKKAIQKSRE